MEMVAAGVRGVRTGVEVTGSGQFCVSSSSPNFFFSQKAVGTHEGMSLGESHEQIHTSRRWSEG